MRLDFYEGDPLVLVGSTDVKRYSRESQGSLQAEGSEVLFNITEKGDRYVIDARMVKGAEQVTFQRFSPQGIPMGKTEPYTAEHNILIKEAPKVLTRIYLEQASGGPERR